MTGRETCGQGGEPPTFRLSVWQTHLADWPGAAYRQLAQVIALSPAEGAGDCGDHRDGKQPAQDVEPGRHRECCPLRIKVARLPKCGRGDQHVEGVQRGIEGWVRARTEGTGWRAPNSHPATNAPASSSKARPGAYPYPASASCSHPHQRAHQGRCRLRWRCFSALPRQVRII